MNAAADPLWLASASNKLTLLFSGKKQNFVIEMIKHVGIK
jgi:hypothetical protein